MSGRDFLLTEGVRSFEVIYYCLSTKEKVNPFV